MNFTHPGRSLYSAGMGQFIDQKEEEAFRQAAKTGLSDTAQYPHRLPVKLQ